MSRVSRAQESYDRLKSGNLRFTQGLRSIENFVTPEKLKGLAENGQKPFAIVLTCSDSRLPAELLFDQGFGDLFVVRVAGNVVAPSLIASIEFAASSFHTPLILVMGHTGCGAIKAAHEYVMTPNLELSENLRDLVSRIEPSVHLTRYSNSFEKLSDFLHECTWNNVEHSMKTITEQSLTIRNLVERGAVEIRGAVYDLKTSKVTFQEEHRNPSTHFQRSLAQPQTQFVSAQLF